MDGRGTMVMVRRNHLWLILLVLFSVQGTALVWRLGAASDSGDAGRGLLC
ncbi:MAG: hypothetical protein ACRD0U_15605 [Acidimicrobiales bacterium]